MALAGCGIASFPMGSALLMLLSCGGSVLKHSEPPPTGTVAELPPYRARALYLAGALALERGAPQAAVQAFSEAALRDPMSAAVLIALADAEDAAGNSEAAARHREKATTLASS